MTERPATSHFPKQPLLTVHAKHNKHEEVILSRFQENSPEDRHEMSKLKFLVTLGAMLVLAHAEGIEKKSEEIEIVPPETHNTTVPPITSTSTTVPTTKIPTTAKPPPETTTTAKPTTLPPHTTTPAPNTTTIAPNTTTPAPITTTIPPPPPTPVPNPKQGSWNVTYTKSNMSCIIAKMAVQIHVPYVTKDNQTKTGYIDLPVNASATGNCGNSSQDITLKWNDDSIVFTFVNNSHTYALKSIKINVVPDANFTDAKSLEPIDLVHTIREFNVTERKSYKCAKVQTLNLTRPDSNDTAGVILVSQLQLQAFNKDNKFVEAVDCEPFDTPDIIPIAAGIALGILIAFVLIGYLVGRRRSQARGYLSMFTQTKREEDYIPMKNLSCFN